MFLMRKIAQLKTVTMAYNSDLNAAVYTRASKSWQDYAAQQIRWMSKTSALKDPLLWLVALIVLFTNFSLVVWTSCSLGAPFLSLQSAPQILKFTITLFVIKFIVDHLSLWMSYGHLKDLKSWSVTKISWPTQITANLIYPFWTTGLLLIGIFYRPDWKGRKIQT